MAETPSIPGVRDGARGAPRRLSPAERLAALVVAGAGLALLLVASRLQPSPDGIGTHQQLGLPPCTWPFAIEIPCPSCGMTTAFAHAARGDMLGAFLAQPFGALLALGTAVAVVAGIFAAVTGTRVLSLFSPLSSKVGLTLVLGGLFAAWGYKILEFRGFLG